MKRGDYPKFSKEYKESDIHRRIKTKISLKDKNGLRVENNKIEKGIEDYITDLKEASDIFFELNQPFDKKAFSDDVYKTFSKIDDIKDTLSKFHRLRNIATFYPLFMSARRVFKDNPQHFLDIVRLSEVFTFRVYIIGNRRSNAKQTTFFRLAYDLHGHKASSHHQKNEQYTNVVDKLNNAINGYGWDEEFENKLKAEQFYWDLQTHEVKYFFFELERYRAVEEKEELGMNWKDIEEKTQEEHIWPQKPKGFDDWTEEKKEEHSKHVHKLGNLTITGWNQTLSNKDFWDEEEFTGKRPIYARSNLRMQRELTKYDKWGIEEINKREDELVKFALERWGYNNE